MNEHIAKGPAPKLHEEAGACLNTDRALWREREGDYYADSIHVTASGAIGINCGGTVIVKLIRAWFALGKESNEKLDLQMAHPATVPTPEAPTLQDQRSENGERTSSLASFDYRPWVPPFSYDPEGTRIIDSRDHLVLDVRGWGFLTGKGSEALAMNEEGACVIQDNIGEHVTKLLNLTSVGRGLKRSDVPRASALPTPPASPTSDLLIGLRREE